MQLLLKSTACKKLVGKYSYVAKSYNVCLPPVCYRSAVYSYINLQLFGTNAGRIYKSR